MIGRAMWWLRRVGPFAVGYMVEEGFYRGGTYRVTSILLGMLACGVFVVLVELWFYLDSVEQKDK